MVNDPIGDMITRIRNAQMRAKSKVSMPGSKQRERVCEVLKTEGYVDEVDVIDDGILGQIRIKLRYSISGEKVIHEIDRVSKPGRRVYKGVDELPTVLNGMGITVVSTSKGVMSDRDARKANIGGELLCVIS